MTVPCVVRLYARAPTLAIDRSRTGSLALRRAARLSSGPSGAVLSAAAEGYIDDFVLVSTGDLDFQVLYVAVTDGFAPPFSAIAVLVNP